MTLPRPFHVCPKCARDLSYSFVKLKTNPTMSNYINTMYTKMSTHIRTADPQRLRDLYRTRGNSQKALHPQMAPGIRGSLW